MRILHIKRRKVSIFFNKYYKHKRKKLPILTWHLPFTVLLGRHARLLTEKPAKMRLVLETHHGCNLFDALTAVMQCNLS